MTEPFVVQPRAARAGPAFDDRAVAGGAISTWTPAARDPVAWTPAARTPVAWTPAARTPAAWTPAMRASVGVADPGDIEPVERLDRMPEKPRHPALESFRQYLDDPDVTDLFVNGASGLFVDRGDGAEFVSEWRAHEQDVRDLAVALIGLGGRHIDEASPCVDVRLAGGMRVHAVLPPVSAGGTAISIRVPRLDQPDLATLQERGLFDGSARERLEELVARRENLLVTGAAGAGKTTLLAALLGCARHTERIVTIEDVAELIIDHPHHVRLEARQANLEGAGAIGLARLVREALRMKPDRLVVGECRGEEIRELLSALNTGHDGGAGTLHANGLHDVPARLEALGALAGLEDRALARQAASAIGCVLHIDRDQSGMRRLAGAGRPVIGASGRIEMEELPWLTG